MANCTNSEPGYFNHECGKPATYKGTHQSGHMQYFCDRCSKEGHEAKNLVTLEPVNMKA